MITIVDYGMGNLRSVQKAFEKIGYAAQITDNPQTVNQAKALVLPGVGAFGDCMSALQKHHLIDPLLEVIASGRPFLGICLGLQLLFDESYEFGKHKGLGIIRGIVERFPQGMKVPHMGWNSLNIKKTTALLPDNSAQPYFYFVHSYYVVPEDRQVIAATTNYGQEFVSMICKDNIYAVQFHPEKSQSLGLNLLKKFGELVETKKSGDRSQESE